MCTVSGREHWRNTETALILNSNLSDQLRQPIFTDGKLAAITPKLYYYYVQYPLGTIEMTQSNCKLFTASIYPHFFACPTISISSISIRVLNCSS